jgi:hypothetical protein
VGVLRRVPDISSSRNTNMINILKQLLFTEYNNICTMTFADNAFYFLMTLDNSYSRDKCIVGTVQLCLARKIDQEMVC